MKNHIIERVKDYIRAPFAFPGGYQKVLVMSDGAVLCHACAADNFRLIVESTRNQVPLDQWAADYVDLFLEGEPEQCEHCYATIHAAYCECQECEPGDEPGDEPEEVNQ